MKRAAQWACENTFYSRDYDKCTNISFSPFITINDHQFIRQWDWLQTEVVYFPMFLFWFSALNPTVIIINLSINPLRKTLLSYTLPQLSCCLFRLFSPPSCICLSIMWTNMNVSAQLNFFQMSFLSRLYDLHCGNRLLWGVTRRWADEIEKWSN